MGSEFIDANFHNVPPAGATALTFGAVSTTAAGTISPTTNAGATPTTSAVTGASPTDRRGRFNLNPVTGGGAQAAGVVAEVRFAKEYAAIPGAVVVTLRNVTAPSSAIVCSASLITTAGFSVSIGAVLVTANVYIVEYVVIP